MKKEDYSLIIRVETEPKGYEGKVELAVKEVKPENANKGLMEAITDKRWKYTGPIESKNDKWPGHDDKGQRYWDIHFLYQIHACGCFLEKKQFVYSVFKYLYMKERHNDGIAYVVLKYPCLSGMSIGNYSPWANVYGGYGYTTVFLVVSSMEMMHLTRKI